MYRRLKNILGVSLMVLAVVLAQIPMPEAQAEETSTVTFSMKGGEFKGRTKMGSWGRSPPRSLLGLLTPCG